ncbi:viral A-type inclusion protein, partial [Reticulomyxa filosa]
NNNNNNSNNNNNATTKRRTQRASLSGSTSNSVDVIEPQEDENTDIVVKVIPILEQLGRGEKAEKLMSECIRGHDTKTELLQLLAAAKDAVNIYGINDALMVVRTMETNALMKALENEAANCKQRNEIFERLKSETADMKKALKTAQTEHDDLGKQIKEIELKSNEKTNDTAQQNRGNLFGRLFFAYAANESKTEEKNVPENDKKIPIQSNMQLGETEIVSSEGMLGNMLLALVGDVGKEMNTILSSGKMPARNTSAEFVALWKDFPDNVTTYIPILQRVSKLGALAFHSFVKSIIDSDGEPIRNYLVSSSSSSSSSSVSPTSPISSTSSSISPTTTNKSTSFRLEFLKSHISQHLVLYYYFFFLLVL